MKKKTPILALTAAVLTVVASSVSGPAFSRSYTSPTGPRGNSFTATSSSHPVKGGGEYGTGTITTTGGRTATASGTYYPATGMHSSSGTASNAQGQSVSYSGSGTGNSGAVTASGSNGQSRTINY